MADRPPNLPEFVVEGQTYETFDFDYWNNYYRSLEQPPDTGGEAAPVDTSGNEAFAPPMPEIIVTPPAPPPPPPAPPRVPAPVIVETAPGLLTRLMPWLGLIVPIPSGPPGTGDAPDDPSTVTQRYADSPPKPPPPIVPTLAEPELPPNWFDIANRPFPGDPIRVPGLPIPYPEVEMPPGEKYFDVSPPRVTPSPLPFDPFTLISTPTPGGFPYDFPGIELSPDLVPDFAPDTGPRSTPAPASPTRIDQPNLVPDWLLVPGPDRSPQPRPANPTAPNPFSTPLPDLIGDPLGNPLPAPDRPTRVSPTPRTPTVPTAPNPFVDIWPDVTGPGIRTPLLDPLQIPTLTEFQPEKKRPDSCQCEKEKPKERKPRPPRAVCYRGTYRQLTKGIQYKRLEQVPCDGPAPKKTTPRKRKKAPTWNDTLRDVFQLP